MPYEDYVLSEENIELRCEVEELQDQLDLALTRAENSEQCVEELEGQILNHGRRRVQKASTKFVSAGSYLAPKFLIGQPLDDNISDALRIALQNYSGPAVKVTSARRWHSHGSDHRTGNAIDISYKDASGKDMRQYLDSDEGKAWLNTYGLNYYLENIRDARHHDNYFYNPAATGPHIHLYVEKKPNPKHIPESSGEEGIVRQS